LISSSRCDRETCGLITTALYANVERALAHTQATASESLREQCFLSILRRIDVQAFDDAFRGGVELGRCYQNVNCVSTEKFYFARELNRA